jgi:hypothetical protein
MSHAFKKEIRLEAKLNETGWNMSSFDPTIRANLKEISGRGKGGGGGVLPQVVEFRLHTCTFQAKLFV